MKIFRKLLLSFAIIFFILTASLALMSIFANYSIIIANISSNKLIALLYVCTVLFFSAFILCQKKKPSVATVCSAALFLATAVIMLTIAFLPQSRFSEHISSDKSHRIVVEERYAHTDINIIFYEEIEHPVYKALYMATIGEDKSAEYQSGDFTIDFGDTSVEIDIPLLTDEPASISYSK